MTKSALYHYFPGKQEVFRAIVNSQMAVLSKQIGGTVAKEEQAEAKPKMFVLTRIPVLRTLQAHTPRFATSTLTGWASWSGSGRRRSEARSR